MKNNSFNVDFAKIREFGERDLSELKKEAAEFAASDYSRWETICLAACCNASEKALGLIPFDEQLVAAVSLYSERVVEMKTGEGKTLSAVFAAFLYKMQGRKVHLFTFNDYLAKRDYNWMKPVYDLLDVKVSLITETTPFEERKSAYNDSDVIYSTVKECGFDFLRDFMVFDDEQKAHKPEIPFDVAIFDEADSILIDEARIPLVIAGDVDASVDDDFTRVFDFVKTFEESDYGIDFETMSVYLKDAGVHKAEEHFGMENLYDEENIDLRCNIETCMKALFYLRENKDYVVKDDRIQLIDALTGRIAQHRLLPGALQSAVEAKHGLKVTERGVVTGVVPIQFFARQYSEIAGMTGTAVPSSEEFELLYGLTVEVISPHNKSKRIDRDTVVYYDLQNKWKAVTKAIVKAHNKKQPVLVGTSSIEESESLAERLAQAGIEGVTVLNAKNDEMEAEIIKNAGQAGAVTVSTNMSGRGIDIKLGGVDESTRDEVVKAGGLLIIGTALYESARMNDQLNGRAGRQGDVGETMLFVSLEDEIMQKYNLKRLIGKWRYPKPTDDVITNKVALREIARIQRIAQGDLLEERKRLLRFTMIGEKHRDIIFKKRLAYLDGEPPGIWEGYSEDEYGVAVKKFGRKKLNAAERKIALSAINEIWCDYLEYTSELRTGIHLRAVGGKNPAEEYNIDCETYFEGAQGRLIDKVNDVLEEMLKKVTIDEIETFAESKLFKPKNARTFLMEESGDELVRKPILLNVFIEDEDE
ncbi:MAG: preprotein translocase subunit SecA [Oscillospiraceae bacterium]|nr:preprotein translocase subunit SecA [Oscillospiraceae bacterium]